MHYRYRWLYALGIFFISFCFSFYYVIHPEWTELRSLKSKTKKLKQEVFLMPSKHDKIFEKFRFLPTKKDFLLILTALEFTTGVKIISLKDKPHLPLTPLEAKMLSLTIQGNHQQVFLFLDQLLEHPFVLLDFNYHFNLKQVLLNIDLLILKNNNLFNKTSSMSKMIGQPHHSFCRQTTSQLLWPPLRQIKMIGYMKQGQRAQAILFLPTHQLVHVDVGTFIGQERGKVFKILPRQIDVFLNQQIVEIKMDQ